MTKLLQKLMVLRAKLPIIAIKPKKKFNNITNYIINTEIKSNKRKQIGKDPFIALI
jgi:hypothetical protein